VDTENRELFVAVLEMLGDDAPRTGASPEINLWTDEHGKPLLDRLEREASLPDSGISGLETPDLARANWTRALGRPDTASLDAGQSVRDDVTVIHDDALRTTLCSQLNGPGATVFLNGQRDRAAAPRAATERDQMAPQARFQLIRPHAKGGIGQVWVARDCELQRDVALKVIQPRYAERDDQRARFLLEAEITGNLEHPGIVPVYSLGHNSEGRPYYAMRFIRGDSLSVAIKRFHEQWDHENAPRTQHRRSKWGVEFRQLLGRFLDVCDAMDYAHNRGVLHRDLKPANIMLGQYGETLVVDWGLAKVIGKNEPTVTGIEGEFEPSLATSSTAVSGATLQGTTIGTPAYMSPEQAEGAIDLVGPGSDVYSLGATLYELLTAKVAFPGKKASQVIAQVLKGEFTPPREVDRSIPAPLEAVCLRAMALDLGHRYQSVRELAEDIEHWMADEPVTAYPERPMERFGRWLRQHRSWTAAAVAGMIGVTVVATAAAFVIETGRRRESAARREAETNFLRAQDVVDDYFTEVSEDTLLKEENIGDLGPLRKQLLTRALNYYMTFVSERKDDPAVRRQLANAYFRVGQITQEIAPPNEALDAFRFARSICERLSATAIGDHELRLRLAECDLAIGKLQTGQGDFTGAGSSFVLARSLLEGLVVLEPESVEFLAPLASCFKEMGISQEKRHNPEQALQLLEKAKTIQQQLATTHPDLAIHTQKLAEIINVLGVIHFRRRDYVLALESFGEVREICERLFEAKPDDQPPPFRLLDLLALAHYNIAEIDLENKKMQQALDEFEQSLKYRRALVSTHPSVTKFQINLGKSYYKFAYALHQRRQTDKAISLIKDSIDVLDRLVQSRPSLAMCHGALGLSWNSLGYFLDEQRKNVEAIPAFQKAVEQQEIAAKLAPDDVEYKLYLVNHLENLGEQYVDLTRAAEGMPYYLRAIEVRRQLWDEHPDKEEHSRDLQKALEALGNIARRAGDPVAARQYYGQARATVESSADGLSQRTRSIAAIQALIGLTFADLGKWQDALGALEQSTATFRVLTTTDTADPEVRGWISEVLWERARVLRELGRLAEAAQLDKERVRLWAGVPATELVSLALNEAGRVRVIGYGTRTLPPQAARVRELDLDVACAHLNIAVAQGFTDVQLVRSHPDGALLLERAEVRSWFDKNAVALEPTRNRP
jgi:eukaryotic-like serine/threonine-protein kinase